MEGTLRACDPVPTHIGPACAPHIHTHIPQPQSTPSHPRPAPVFIDVEPHMRIWKEEIFGPVLSGGRQGRRGSCGPAGLVAWGGAARLPSEPSKDGAGADGCTAGGLRVVGSISERRRAVWLAPLQPAPLPPRRRPCGWPTRASLGWGLASSPPTQSAAGGAAGDGGHQGEGSSPPVVRPPRHAHQAPALRHYHLCDCELVARRFQASP